MRLRDVPREYIRYLKDNPEGYWFKARWFGWGWVPAKWQGWLVTGIFIAFILWTAFRLPASAPEQVSAESGRFLARVFIAILVLIIIAYWKGEKPRWQWGPPKKREGPEMPEDKPANGS